MKGESNDRENKTTSKGQLHGFYKSSPESIAISILAHSYLRSYLFMPGIKNCTSLSDATAPVVSGTFQRGMHTLQFLSHGLLKLRCSGCSAGCNSGNSWLGSQADSSCRL